MELNRLDKVRRHVLEASDDFDKSFTTESFLSTGYVDPSLAYRDALREVLSEVDKQIEKVQRRLGIKKFTLK